MILDTDILIDIHRLFPSALAWFASLTEVPKVAGLAAMELTEGARNLRELKKVQKLLAPFTLCWPTETDMQTALTVYQPLRLAHGIGLIDCLIAATATGLGEELATLNLKHYGKVSDLVTIQPYKK